MNTKVIILVIVLILVLVGLLWWFPITPRKVIPSPSTTTSEVAPAEDTTATINKDLGNIQLDKVDADFKDVDKDLQSL